MMVGGNTSKIQAWDEVIGKLKARLSKWKLKTLSVGGRLTLLKAVGDSQLRHLFPRLFALETKKDCSVASKIQSSVISTFRRPVKGGIETAQLDLLEKSIEGTILSTLDDRWIWDLNGEGVFQGCYQVMLQIEKDVGGVFLCGLVEYLDVEEPAVIFDATPSLVVCGDGGPRWRFATVVGGVDGGGGASVLQILVEFDDAEKMED
ncbi:hypothetical protein Tco_0712052 [Tanacetum coccineum]